MLTAFYIHPQFGPVFIDNLKNIPVIFTNHISYCVILLQNNTQYVLNNVLLKKPNTGSLPLNIKWGISDTSLSMSDDALQTDDLIHIPIFKPGETRYLHIKIIKLLVSDVPFSTFSIEIDFIRAYLDLSACIGMFEFNDEPGSIYARSSAGIIGEITVFSDSWYNNIIKGNSVAYLHNKGEYMRYVIPYDTNQLSVYLRIKIGDSAGRNTQIITCTGPNDEKLFLFYLDEDRYPCIRIDNIILRANIPLSSISREYWISMSLSNTKDALLCIDGMPVQLIPNDVVNVEELSLSEDQFMIFGTTQYVPHTPLDFNDIILFAAKHDLATQIQHARNYVNKLPISFESEFFIED